MKTKKQDGLKEFFISEGHLEVALSFANIGIDNNVYTKGEESNSINEIDMYNLLVKNFILGFVFELFSLFDTDCELPF